MACLHVSPLLLLTSLLTLACGPGSGGETGDTGSSTTAASTGGDTSSGATPTTGDAPTGSTTDGTTGSTTGSTSTADTSSGPSGSSGGDSSTGALECSLEQAAHDMAASNGEFEDCGNVHHSNDDLAAWQAAHDCAIAAAKKQGAFKVVLWLQGFDSEVGEAYASLLGRSYGLTHFTFDSDPCGGENCGPVLHARSCVDLVATPDCTVEPGNACLTCVMPGTQAQLCGPE